MSSTKTLERGLDVARRQYEEDGATVLRGVVPLHWIDRIAAATDEIANDPKAGHTFSRRGEGRFFGDVFSTLRVPEYKAFVQESGLAQIAAELMGSKEIRFFYDQLFVKEPNTPKKTPWHQDLPYWPLTGEQILSMWVPMDAATPETGVVTYVKGSHRWQAFFPMEDWADEPPSGPPEGFKIPEGFQPPEGFHPPAGFKIPEGFEIPEGFKLPENFKPPEGLQSMGGPPARAGIGATGKQKRTLADINANPENYELITWSVEPGDVIIHHASAIHSAPGNASPTARRRALAARWIGDDVRWDDTRPHFMQVLKHFPNFPYPTALQTGDALDDPLFPKLWPA